MTRAEKTNTKFIKRNSFDFEHIKINLHRDARDDRDERSNKKIKKFFVTNIVTVMKADIQTIKKANAIINRDVQAILTKAEVKAKTKKASNDLIVNTNKTIIKINSDDEFEAFTTDEKIMKEIMNMFN